MLSLTFSVARSQWSEWRLRRALDGRPSLAARVWRTGPRLLFLRNIRMKTGTRRSARAVIAASLVLWFSGVDPAIRAAVASNLTLKDGRVLEGRVGQVSKLAADPLKP